MIKKMFRFNVCKFFMMMFLVPVAGCQTSSSLDSADARKYQEMMNKNCISTRTKDGYTTNEGKTPFRVVSVNYGEDGWVSATAVAQDKGFIDNFYFNEKTKKGICGTSNFRKMGHIFIKK